GHREVERGRAAAPDSMGAAVEDLELAEVALLAGRLVGRERARGRGLAELRRRSHPAWCAVPRRPQPARRAPLHRERRRDDDADARVPPPPPPRHYLPKRM